MKETDMRRIANGLLVVFLVFGTVSVAQNVVTEDLVDGLKDPTSWLSYSGDYSGKRHSPLTGITPANVEGLKAEWTFQTGVLGKFEATPIVLDGIIYISGPDNNAWAIDARTGRTIWRYRRNLPGGLSVCCGRVNRGLAVFGDKLFMVTLDIHLLALDMKTGRVVYDVAIDDHELGYTGTVAPLVVNDKVIVGVAGAEFGVRGFIDAFDIETGVRAWRFWTVPGPGEPGTETWAGDSWAHGGAPTWVTGTFDPELNLVYWGTGNPSPDYNGEARLGDNLYSNCVLALDADTGELRWYFQFTPHDTHDWDSNHVPVLLDREIDGVRRKLISVANRNGFFYTLDRTNGELLVAKPYINTTWAKEIDSDGRPVVLPDTEPTEEGNYVCPDLFGGTNFMSPSFNPDTGLFYVTARETCAVYFKWEQEFVVGERYEGGAVRREGDTSYGALRAIEPLTGDLRWEFRYEEPAFAGAMSTASGLVFAGDQDGYIMAFDAEDGELLWRYPTGSGIYAAPTTFMLDGRQYMLIPSGTTLTAFALGN
jgi:alcohol dehydrogenase (cytochrome c)